MGVRVGHHGVVRGGGPGGAGKVGPHSSDTPGFGRGLAGHQQLLLSAGGEVLGVERGAAGLVQAEGSP